MWCCNRRLNNKQIQYLRKKEKKDEKSRATKIIMTNSTFYIFTTLRKSQYAKYVYFYRPRLSKNIEFLRVN